MRQVIRKAKNAIRSHERQDSSTTLIPPSWSEHLFEHGHFGLFRLDDTIESPNVVENARNIYEVDVVIIHGLNGHPQRTWTHDNGCCWIRDLLPKDLPGARVFTYGYPSKILFNHFIAGVRQYATDLLHQLLERRRDAVDHNRSILYVCHSMGGLVLKQAMITASEKPQFASIWEASTGVIFLGTPHRGSDFAALAKSLGDLINLAHPLGGKPINTRLLRTLEHDSQELIALADSFTPRSRKLEIMTFFETEETPGLNKLVVQEFSATMGLEHEIARPLFRNHRDLCRFASASDNSYSSVLYAIQQLAKSSQKAEDSPVSTPKTDISYDEVEQKCLAVLNKTSIAEYILSLERRVEGTLTWIETCEQYSDWRSMNESSILWISGLPGCGKTMLASYIWDRLHQDPLTQVLICRFYCSQHVEDLTSGLTLIQSFIFQAVDRRRRLLKPVKRCSERGGMQNLTQTDILWGLFEQIVRDDRISEVFIVVDAIDELNAKSQSLLTQRLGQLIQLECNTTIKLLVTSRPNCIAVASMSKHVQSFYHCEMESHYERVQRDVTLLVNAKLSILVEKGSCRAHVRDVLADQLISQAGSTFLWISLVLPTLERRGALRSKDASKLWNQLPSKLSDIYSHLLDSIDPADSAIAAKLLRTIAMCGKPLTGQELAVLVTIDVEHHTVALLEADCEIDDRMIEALLGPLVRISQGKVYLVHQSLREHLRTLSLDSGTSRVNTFRLDETEHALELCRACMLYLGLDEFGTDFADDPWNTEIEYREGSPKSLAEFQAFRDSFDLTIFEDQEDHEKTARKRISTRFLLYDFAVSHWPKLFAAHGGVASKHHVDLALELCRSGMRTRRWFSQYCSILQNQLPRNFAPVIISAYCGLLPVLNILLTQDEIPESELGDALYSASRMGHSACIAALLPCHERIVAHNRYLHDSLFVAAEYGHLECVKVLLNSAAVDVNDASKHSGRTILSLAAGQAHTAMVQYLLKRADLMVNRSDKSGFTPLMHAIFAGSTEITTLLCRDPRTNILQCDLKGRSALSWAAEEGEPKIVNELLTDGRIDPAQTDTLGQTALIHAARKGNNQAVRLLARANPACVQIIDNTGRNALSWSAAQPNHHVVAYLLSQHPPGAAVADKEGWGPLAWALDPPCRSANVSLLLRCPYTLINQKDRGSGRTPLSWAASFGYLTIVKEMAAVEGIELDASDTSGKTPLAYAALVGSADVVKFLISCAGVNSGAKDLTGRTPRDWAILNGHEHVVKILDGNPDND